MAAKIRRILSALAIAALCGLSGVSAAGMPADWQRLTPPQRELLAPLADQWASFSTLSQRKWLGIADRYLRMSPQEQATMRSRVAEWARLTPNQRQAARAQYKKIQAAPGGITNSTQQQWQQYNALPAEEKERIKNTRKDKVPAGKSGVSSSIVK